jgi:hypothetical protein
VGVVGFDDPMDHAVPWRPTTTAAVTAKRMICAFIVKFLLLKEDSEVRRDKLEKKRLYKSFTDPANLFVARGYCLMSGFGSSN